MTFGKLIDTNKSVTEKDFDYHVGEWEKGAQNRPVSEHLEISPDEFAYICLEPDFQKAIENVRLSRSQENQNPVAHQ